jgi:hypothetical protein
MHQTKRQFIVLAGVPLLACVLYVIFTTPPKQLLITMQMTSAAIVLIFLPLMIAERLTVWGRNPTQARRLAFAIFQLAYTALFFLVAISVIWQTIREKHETTSVPKEELRCSVPGQSPTTGLSPCPPKSRAEADLSRRASPEDVPLLVPRSGLDERRPSSGDVPGSVPQFGPDDRRPFTGDGSRSVPQSGPDDL